MLLPWLRVSLGEVMIINIPQILVIATFSTLKAIGSEEISINSLIYTLSRGECVILTPPTEIDICIPNFVETQM